MNRSYRATRRNVYFGRDPVTKSFPGNYSPYANLRRQRKLLRSTFANVVLEYIPPRPRESLRVHDACRGMRSQWPGALKPHANPSAPYGSLFRIAPMPK